MLRPQVAKGPYLARQTIAPFGMELRARDMPLALDGRTTSYEPGSAYLGTWPRLKVSPALAGKPVALRYQQWGHPTTDCPGGP